MRISDWSSRRVLFRSSGGARCAAPLVLSHLLLDHAADVPGRGRPDHRLDRPAGHCRLDGRRRADFLDRGDRKSVVEGKGVSVRVDIGGLRIIKNKKTMM